MVTSGGGGYEYVTVSACVWRQLSSFILAPAEANKESMRGRLLQRKRGHRECTVESEGGEGVCVMGKSEVKMSVKHQVQSECMRVCVCVIVCAG